MDANLHPSSFILHPSSFILCRPMLSQDARRALELWLEYTETRRTLTARLFAARDDVGQIQDLLDENDRRLEEAIGLTRRLLGDEEAGEPEAQAGDRRAGG
jgi:hypothetical protein